MTTISKILRFIQDANDIGATPTTGCIASYFKTSMTFTQAMFNGFK